MPQKKAVLKLSSGLAVSLFVRKMVQDDSPCEISTSERARAEENNVSSKRQKTEDETEETKEATVNQREADKTKLFLHKIPHDVPSQELHGVLNGDFTLDVKVILDIEHSNLYTLFFLYHEVHVFVICFWAATKKKRRLLQCSR